MDVIKNSFEKYKNFWILGIAVVVVAVLAVGTSYVRTHRAEREEVRDDEVSLESCKSGDAFDALTGKPCPKDLSVKGEAPATVVPADRTISFTDNCHPSIDNLTVTNGSRIMLRNSGTTDMTLRVNGREETLRPLRYFTSVLKSVDQYDIQCGGETVAQLKAI